MKVFLKKRLPYILVSVVVLMALVLVLVTTLMTVAKYKTDMTMEIWKASLFESLKHPIQSSKNYWNEKNPAFILLSVGAIFYPIFLSFSNQKKKKNWQADDTGYQGTARFLKESELVDGENFLSQTPRQFNSLFEKSLKGGKK